MRNNQFYTHPKFLDVYFKVSKCGFYGGKYRFKAEWFSRIGSLRITTKHKLDPKKAEEFILVSKGI